MTTPTNTPEGVNTPALSAAPILTGSTRLPSVEIMTFAKADAEVVALLAAANSKRGKGDEAEQEAEFNITVMCELRDAILTTPPRTLADALAMLNRLACKESGVPAGTIPGQEIAVALLRDFMAALSRESNTHPGKFLPPSKSEPRKKFTPPQKRICGGEWLRRGEAVPTLAMWQAGEQFCHLGAQYRKALRSAIFGYTFPKIAVRNSVGIQVRMAKLSELIPALANTLGMPETAIEAYAKALRKAGLITTGGRGFGAADMNSGDCARLLTAIMAGSPTYAVERVKTYGNLTCATEPGEAGRPVYEAFCLTPGHSFVDMLSHIIELAKKDPINKFCTAALSKANLIPKYKKNDLICILKIEVEFPEPNASIEVNGFFGISQLRAVFGFHTRHRNTGIKKANRVLMIHSTVTLSTIQALAKTQSMHSEIF